ncbi:ATPase, T2SS/T4P/T4SS family [Bradyrhizobium sp. USDA 4353]
MTLNSADRNIFTVYGSVEYRIPGVNQVQVQSVTGQTFLYTLLARIRQDTDLAICDIKKAETDIADSAIARLIDIGVENYLPAPKLKNVITRKLKHKLGLNCTSSDPKRETGRTTLKDLVRSPEATVLHVVSHMFRQILKLGSKINVERAR